MSQLDSDHFRRTLGSVPTSVVVVTTTIDDDPFAMVIGSFTSVSLDPPLVGYFGTTASSSFQKMASVEHFAVNVLAADHEGLCRQMAGPAESRFEGVDWTSDRFGNPVLDGTVASISCRTYSVTDAGDHQLVLGEVLAMGSVDGSDPLVFHRGAYGTVVCG